MADRRNSSGKIRAAHRRYERAIIRAALAAPERASYRVRQWLERGRAAEARAIAQAEAEAALLRARKPVGSSELAGFESDAITGSALPKTGTSR